MSYKSTIYASVRLGTPGSDQAAQLAVFDYANSESISITASSTAEDATALPAGCFMAWIKAAASNSGVVRVRGDGTDADGDSPFLNPGDAEPFVVTASDRQFSLYGTQDDVVTITPYLITFGGAT